MAARFQRFDERLARVEERVDRPSTERELGFRSTRPEPERTSAGQRPEAAPQRADVKRLAATVAEQRTALQGVRGDLAEVRAKLAAAEEASGQQVFEYGQAADYLKIGASTLRALVATGDIPCVRIGATVRIRRAALDTFLKERERAQGRRNGTPRLHARPHRPPEKT